jgi:hyperosmotically inducible protein
MLALVAVLALGGCQKREESPNQPPGPPGGARETARDAGQAVENAVEGVGQAAGNAVLTAKVKNALMISKDLDTSKLNVDTTKDGIVTLKGSVTTAAMKDRAARVAKQVAGVKGVKNELVVAGAQAGN